MIDDLIQHIPVTHLSFSAVRQFLSDPRKFKKNYIDGLWNDLTPIAMAEGSAYHAGLEHYWQVKQSGDDTNDVELVGGMVNVARDYLLTNKDRIEWPMRRIAKKDADQYEVTELRGNMTYAQITPESVVASLEGVFVAYVNEELEITPLGVEDALVGIVKDFETGEELPVPVKLRLDLYGEIDGKRVVVDHKYMRSAPSKDEDDNYIVDPAWRLQAACYEAIIESEVGERPDAFYFDVMPKTGEPELHRVEVVLDDRDRLAWSRLLKGTIYQLAVGSMMEDPDLMFLPNPFSGYDNDGWHDFLVDVEATLDFDQPKEPEEEKVKPVKL